MIHANRKLGITRRRSTAAMDALDAAEVLRGIVQLVEDLLGCEDDDCRPCFAAVTRGRRLLTIRLAGPALREFHRACEDLRDVLAWLEERHG